MAGADHHVLTVKTELHRLGTSTDLDFVQHFEIVNPHQRGRARRLVGRHQPLFVLRQHEVDRRAVNFLGRARRHGPFGA